MRDWLTIQYEKSNDIRLREFIQANPVLDRTMRTLLANYLNVSEPNVQKWIQDYQREGSEHLQSYINHVHRCIELLLPKDLPPLLMYPKSLHLSKTICTSSIIKAMQTKDT